MPTLAEEAVLELVAWAELGMRPFQEAIALRQPLSADALEELEGLSRVRRDALRELNIDPPQPADARVAA